MKWWDTFFPFTVAIDDRRAVSKNRKATQTGKVNLEVTETSTPQANKKTHKEAKPHETKRNKESQEAKSEGDNVI